MADVFTIDDLNALATLTTADEIPVWDAEASGEPTKKITASNLAASVKYLGNLIGTGDLDSTPTSGSNKAVTSGGVYTAIQQSTADVIRTGDVVNNLTSTATDKPLAAAQGKALSEAIAQSAASIALFNKTYSASSISDFLGQILDDAIAMGAGNHVLGCTWQYHCYCSVMASAQSATRAVIMAVPQPSNMNYIFVAETNNGTKTYKQIATTSIT